MEPAPAGHLSQGLALVVSAIRRDPQNPIVTLKTTSRADYVFARLEARRAGAEDALFLTIDGHLSESTTSNIFLVRTAEDGALELATPSLDCAILAGTTRSWLLRWAAGAGLRPVEGHLTPDELATADEAFVSSSVAGMISGRMARVSSQPRSSTCFAVSAAATSGRKARAMSRWTSRVSSALQTPHFWVKHR